ncbi:MAG TPA: GDCCVxC domain-containing (seleno)protein [Xanthobacteraceae bacterium]|nr:GDCCVxC domain-containing (seleno)protein [Xanthobacteraceae bacterium]
MLLHSIISCPACGHQSEERMPVDACQFFYICKGCQTRLRPLPGDCCVFCSFGTVRCPSMQSGGHSC